jgi:hypothetical protein
VFNVRIVSLCILYLAARRWNSAFNKNRIIQTQIYLFRDYASPYILETDTSVIQFVRVRFRIFPYTRFSFLATSLHTQSRLECTQLSFIFLEGNRSCRVTGRKLSSLHLRTKNHKPILSLPEPSHIAPWSSRLLNHRCGNS